jgi:hypothetical protein
MFQGWKASTTGQDAVIYPIYFFCCNTKRYKLLVSNLCHLQERDAPDSRAYGKPKESWW